MKHFNELEKLSLVASKTENAVIITDKDGFIDWVNAAFTRITGYELHEVSGKKPGSFLQGPETSKSTIEIVRNKIKEQVSFTEELVNYTKSGEPYWVKMDVSPIYDAAQVCIGFIAVESDISERKLYEQQLIEKKISLAYAQEISKIGNWSFNITTYEVKWSDNLFKIFEIDPDTTNLYEAYINSVHPEDLPHLQQLINEAVTLGNDYVVEHRILVPGNDIKYIRGIAKVAKNKYGAPVALFGTAQDITVEKTYELELLKAKETAELATVAKSSFLAMMSHEIRTPLNGIMGAADLASKSCMNSEQAELINVIKKSGKTLLKLINDILDFSKLEAGHVSLDEENTELLSCVQDVYSLLQLKAKERSNELSFSIDDSLPQFIVADGNRLKQILINLVGNAVKFTEKGRVDIRVAREKNIADKICIRFTVKDTGIGIPADKQANLFKEFYQVESMKSRRFEGTGLGLSISKKLVSLMEGDFTVTSEAGKGSSFSFTMLTKAGDNLVKGTTAPQQVIQKNELNHLKILVAEDNDINVFLAQKLLNNLDIKPDLARDGLIAVEKASENKYDIILMDIHMPNMDGLEATKTILSSLPKEQQPKAIIAMTADAFRENEEACLKAGMNDFISKPLDTEKFYAMLKKWSDFFSITDRMAI
ncbi:MAG: ATP-binding protein [Flavihumibacter sp.]|nr:ATP-binding protein [Flavihumibacter sp.]